MIRDADIHIILTGYLLRLQLVCGPIITVPRSLHDH